jgi:hypothetical protein
LDITFLNPFAVTGALNFTCNTPPNGTGTYTGSIIVTYPVAGLSPLTTIAGSLTGNNAFNNVVAPTLCSVTNGIYSIDPTTGLITSTATLANPTSVPSGLVKCLDLFSDTSLADDGYLSDPSAKKLYVLEIGQQQSDVLSLVYTKDAQ